MKGKVLLVVLLIVVVALVSIGATLRITRGNMEQACAERPVTVLNPALSNQMAERVPLAPRADTLEGKTIYLVDLQWGGPEAGYSVFEEMQKWFAKNMPSVKVELRRSNGGWMGDDPALRKEIAEKKAAGVVIGIGG
jgi:hypothetical protein